MRSLRELSSMEGRVALVTGGAGHIGLAVAETLLEAGANVHITDLDADATRRRAESLASLGTCSSAGVDLSSETATRAMVRDAIAAHGRLDVLVHCAAFVGTSRLPGWAVPFDAQSVEAWDAAYRVNVTSAFVMAQEARSALRQGKKGSILLFSSIYGMVAPDHRLYQGTDMASPVAYGTSKASVLQLARHLASELAPDVRVNAITPGGVLRGQPEPFLERYVAKTPLGRMAREEDLKGAVLYLASDLSSYVTGQNLVVDGGWTMW